MLEVRVVEAKDIDGVKCKVGQVITINKNTAIELEKQGIVSFDLEAKVEKKPEIKPEKKSEKKEKIDNGEE